MEPAHPEKIGERFAIRVWNKSLTGFASKRRRLIVEASKCVVEAIRSDGRKGRLEIYFGIEAKVVRG